MFYHVNIACYQNDKKRMDDFTPQCYQTLKASLYKPKFPQILCLPLSTSSYEKEK